jgi:hypothetical protein
MEFKKLLEPYSELDEQGSPKRTTEGQIKWLSRRHGLPRDIVDKAILKVYQELEEGLLFDDAEGTTPGHKLDQYLLATAKQIQDENLTMQTQELEKFMNTFKKAAVEKYVKAQQGSVWKRIKAVFKPV